jgi:hypothetical protein
LVSSRCGAFPPVDGFCVGGHAVEQAGDEFGVSAAASGEAELPEFSNVSRSRRPALIAIADYVFGPLTTLLPQPAH